MPNTSGYQAIRNYLNSHKPAKISVRFNIDRMQLFAGLLGSPESKFPIIHIAGTNGKGSTGAMIEAIYRANGYKTGLYTSPHLIHEAECIQINRQMISETSIAGYVRQIKPIAAKMSAKEKSRHPSFFELMTAIAFLYFADAGIDIAIVEAGLGGRFDATNIVKPALSVITSISMDHTEQLGESIEEIATEKAGIIKPEKPVLIGRLPNSAEISIQKIAQEKKCTLYSIRERFPEEEELPKTNLEGSFQRWNAAVAVHATEILNSHFNIDAKRTIKPALQAIKWPGRWQTVPLADKTLILDTSHNQEGFETLRENLKNLLQQTMKKPVIIAGSAGEQRARSLMSVVGHYARELHLIAPKQPNSTPTKVLETFLLKEHSTSIFHQKIEDIFPALDTCTVGKPNDTLVITGSIYLVGEVLKQLKGEIPC